MQSEVAVALLQMNEVLRLNTVLEGGVEVEVGVDIGGTLVALTLDGPDSFAAKGVRMPTGETVLRWRTL